MKQYAVIQARLNRGKRTYFEKEGEAEKEARDILERVKRYPGYEPPDELLIVKVIGVVEISSKRRKLRAADTEEE